MPHYGYSPKTVPEMLQNTPTFVDRIEADGRVKFSLYKYRGRNVCFDTNLSLKETEITPVKVSIAVDIKRIFAYKLRK